MAVQSELIPISMQHISHHIRNTSHSSLITTNRDKRMTGIRYIALIIISVMITLTLSAPFAYAEAPVGDTFVANIIDQVNQVVSGTTPVDELVDGLTVAERAAKIDAFFASKGNLPLTGQGIVFVQMADKYGIDWKLLPAIGFLESTGGKFVPSKNRYNAFGWGSAKIKFESYTQAIETVSKNLGGHNPVTAQHYDDKTLDEIINAYNPPSVRADYNKIIKGTMAKIAKADISNMKTAPVNQLAMK